MGAGVSPKPCACRPARTAASAVRNWRARPAASPRWLVFLRCSCDLAVLAAGWRADGMNPAGRHGFGNPSLVEDQRARCFSAWRGAMRPVMSGPIISSSRQPGETPAPRDKRAATAAAASAFVFVLRIFLQHELFKQPDGKPQSRSASMNSTKASWAGINSTEPVNGLGDSGCNFFLTLHKSGCDEEQLISGLKPRPVVRYSKCPVIAGRLALPQPEDVGEAERHRHERSEKGHAEGHVSITSRTKRR